MFDVGISSMHYALKRLGIVKKSVSIKERCHMKRQVFLEKLKAEHQIFSFKHLVVTSMRQGLKLLRTKAHQGG